MSEGPGDGPRGRGSPKLSSGATGGRTGRSLGPWGEERCPGNMGGADRKGLTLPLPSGHPPAPLGAQPDGVPAGRGRELTAEGRGSGLRDNE